MNTFQINALTVAIITALSTPLFAETAETTVDLDDDKLVFTANRIASSKDETGTRSDIVTEKAIEQQQFRTVQEALATQPGVTLSQNGVNGPTSLFIRGANTEHTLVMIDGVPLGDPMGTGRSVDYTLLGNMTNIERIEVLKGPQSTLYGSSAMGGVVQIFTKKGKEPKTRLSLEGGSFNTFRTMLSTSGMTDRLQYSLAGSLENSHGVDATTDTPGKLDKDRDRDHYKNRILSANLNFLVTEALDFDFMIRYNRHYSEYDNAFNATDYNDYWRSKQLVGRIAANFHLLDDQLNSSLSYTVNDIKRDNYSGNVDFVTQDPVFDLLKFRGKTQTVNLHNTLSLHKDFETVFGASYAHEKGKQNNGLGYESINTKSLYLDQHLNFNERFFNTIGFRYDKNSRFGSKVTYRITSRFDINDQFSLKGSFGTGFNAPNVYQLYDSFSGNRNLKAETSRGFDLGIVFKPNRRSEIELTYFDQKFKNLIDYHNEYDANNNWVGGYYDNIERAKMRGIELSGRTEVTDKITLGMSYTYLDAKKKSNDDGIYHKMERRPENQFNANLNYAPNERLNLNLNARYYSHRKEIGDARLGSFATFDVAASYRFSDRVEVTAKVNNLFDKKYTYAKGFRQPGIAGYIGVNIEF